MTTGIYKLNFINTDKVYIGQSLNIEDRYNSHIYTLKSGKASIKLQNAYKTYGIPTVEILLECSSDELDATETEAINIYNAYIDGFNSLQDAKDIPKFVGELHGRALYNNEQVEKAFLILVNNPTLSYTKISELTGIKPSNLYLISNGTNHRWLEEKYPDKYKLMLSYIGKRLATCQSASNRNTEYPKIISPTGGIYKVENIRGFALTHNLDQGCLGRLLRYKAKSHKGWKRVDA